MPDQYYAELFYAPQFKWMCLTLLIFFVIGAMGLWHVNKRKSDEDKREAWKKYFLYLLIVWPLLFLFRHWESMQMIMLGFKIALAIGAVIEVIMVTKDKPQLRAVSLIFLLLVLTLFVGSSSLDFSFAVIFFGVVIFDGFSQLTGQLIGGPKILPKISPKKTIGGTIGGTVITCTTLYFIIGDILPLTWMLYLCVSAFFGDFFTSLLKRKAEVKDFNNLIPGHGGLLDRFDSFIFSVAASNLLLIIHSILSTP